MPSFEEIRDLSQSDDPIQRLAALLSLRFNANDHETTAMVRQLAQDSDPAVREAASDWLSEHIQNTPQLLKPMTFMVSDPSPDEVLVQAIECAIVSQPSETEVPRLPQADDLDKVLEIGLRFDGRKPDIGELENEMGISSRQIDYYRDAATFLKLQVNRSSEIADFERIPSDFDFPRSPTVIDSWGDPLGIAKLSSQLASNYWPFWNLILNRLLGEMETSTFSTDIEAFAQQVNADRKRLGKEYSDSTLKRRIATLTSWGSQLESHLDAYEASWPIPRARFAPTPIDLEPVLLPLGALGEEEIDHMILHRLSSSDNPLLSARRKTFTLQFIGDVFGLSREAIRLREKKIRAVIHVALREDGSQLKEIFDEHFRNEGIIDLGALRATAIRSIKPSPRTGRSENYSHALRILLVDVVLTAALRLVGASPLRKNPLFWARNPSMMSELEALFPPTRAGRGKAVGKAKVDLVVAFLEERGPTSKAELAASFDTKETVLWNLLSTDKRLSYNHLTKNWSCAEPFGSKQKYRSVHDAVLDVIQEIGPIAFGDLLVSVEQRHPVSQSRISQALDSQVFGRTPDGNWDLVSRGAVRPVQKEPKIPTSLSVQDSVITFHFVASKDHVRGSATALPMWVGWRAGLSASPMSVDFKEKTTYSTIKISRASGAIRVSSLRTEIANVNATTGCAIAMELDFGSFTFELRHVCLECSPKSEGVVR